MLLFLLQQKFRNIPEPYRQKVLEANPVFLQMWAERIDIFYY